MFDNILAVLGNSYNDRVIASAEGKKHEVIDYLEMNLGKEKHDMRKLIMKTEKDKVENAYGRARTIENKTKNDNRRAMEMGNKTKNDDESASTMENKNTDKDRIRRVKSLPVDVDMLCANFFPERIIDLVKSIENDFMNYIKRNSLNYVKLKGYPTLITTKRYANYLIDMVDVYDRDLHYSYNNYVSVKDSLAEQRPKNFVFQFPSHVVCKGLTDILRPIYGDYVVCKNDSNQFCYTTNNYNSYSNFNSYDRYYAVDVKVATCALNESVFTILVKNSFVPEIADRDIVEKYCFVVSLKNEGLVYFEQNEMKFKFENNIKLENLLIKYNFKDFLINNDQQKAMSEISKLSEQGKEWIAGNYISNILRFDTLRADIKEYDPMMLEDPNRGSWDLWYTKADGDKFFNISEGYYARDPRLDILEDGVVGIDFGTKSTVVVAQDDSDRIEAMRIGMGRFEKAPSMKDYENPTVMEFINIDDFLKAYYARDGRPHTKWADVTSSHTAFNDWKENDKSENYFAFFGELKQWAGDSERRIRIRDKEKKEISLPPYDEIKDGDFDPIEIYAYYIGLYINNMHTGRIYMEYLLSFPVTYSLDIRQRILNSFSKGLKKSLPQPILDDVECMEKFTVEQGVGEPAAYAVCALQNYHLQPKEKENIVYGIFDFGGGTTDFDFGVWRKAEGPKERRYRYVIQHFGDGGDKYLGGENLLELLAFEVFKANQAELRKNEISFVKPSECPRFAGSEILLRDSQEAHANMRQMMEKLRPLWEHTPDYEKEYSSGIVKLRLFKNDGQVINSQELKINVKSLEEILKKRINKGVEAFFDALLANFSKAVYADVLKKTKKIHIFLAGNSSKSVILQEIFNEKIKAFTNILSKKMGTIAKEGLFIIYPPLGTADSEAKLKELGIVNNDQNDLDKPTGKTGVAIGLVQCRKGSKIKVISEVSSEEEIRFRYWIGDVDDDNYFVTIINRDIKYNEWVPYIDAGVDRFEFYYTTNTTAGRERGLLVSEAKKARLKLPKNAVNEDWYVYLRAVGPSTIEYAVAESDEDVIKGRFKYGPVSLGLDE